MLRTRLVPALCTLCLAAFAASASAQTAGTYQLKQVGQDNLPAVVDEEEGCREEVSSATLTLDAKGGWKLNATGREVCGDKVETETEMDSGRYTMAGKNIHFREDDNDEGEADDDEDALDDLAHGVIDGNTLRIPIGTSGRFLVFQKQ